MVAIRSLNEIILNLVDFYRITQPDADTKPGTAIRDLFIEGPASQLALLYEELSSISDKQSLRLAVGSDLDLLAKNFGLTRRQSSSSTGVALFTFSSIVAPININAGYIVTANNGYSFSVRTGTVVSPLSINFYKSVASKFRAQLDTAGITDQYAVEVTVTATFPGAAGNIGQYSINKTNISGVSNVTNIYSFNGGSDQESDLAFRTRILAAFTGSSIGTALGYLNAALAITGVADAYVVQPGDVLMERDGTVVSTGSDGTKTIVSEGSGGKVDIIVLGSNLTTNTDSYIYQDKSNTNDPTDSKNNFILGQIAEDANKTINRKRIDDIAKGILPSQPVDSIVSISGTLSGSNFVEKTIDQYGRINGNYELIKDSGEYSGSPWGFDAIHWISDRVSGFSEDKIKTQQNSQDALSFSGVLNITKATQNISVTNENSLVTYDRSIIQLLHTPATNVTRVFNINTGERYLITNQNLDNTSPYNSTGRIQISGNTLPAPNDILQVDYTVVNYYDNNVDFDGLSNTNNVRLVSDSIDWGYSSSIKDEPVLFSLDATSNFYVGSTYEPIYSIAYISKLIPIDGIVGIFSSGKFIGRKYITLSNLIEQTSSIYSIKLKNSNVELYNTSDNNGTYYNSSIVIGTELRYVTTIVLPTDANVSENSHVTAFINKIDVFSSSSSNGTINNNIITLPSSLVNAGTATQIKLYVSYIAANNKILSCNLDSKTINSKLANSFINSNAEFSNYYPTNIIRREFAVVNSGTVALTSAGNASLTDVISIINIANNKEYWNESNKGTINSSTNIITLSGYNSPTDGDQVLVLYFATDLNNLQPFTYHTSIIRSYNGVLNDLSGLLYVNAYNISSDGPVTFEILEPNTNIVLKSNTDGMLVATSSKTMTMSSSTSFSSIYDIINKKIRITNSPNIFNDGYYDINNYDPLTNTLFISNEYENILNSQISIIDILSGRELWNENGAIDLVNNRFMIDTSIIAKYGLVYNRPVYVIVYNYKNLRKSSTKYNASISGPVTNPGTLAISGKTIAKAENIVFNANYDGLKQNMSEAVRLFLGLNSTSNIPSTIKLINIVKLEKVNTISINSSEVLNVIASYDLKNITLNNNFYYDNILSDKSYSNYDFKLNSTVNNTDNSINIGDKLRATFYIVNESDSETLSFNNNGTLFTNKKFGIIDKIYTSGGFNYGKSTSLSSGFLNQPNPGSRYRVTYDYLAPKKNERITIQSNYNKLISDVTFGIELNRVINADVLVKAANKLEVDVIVNIVILPAYLTSKSTIVQNVKNNIISTLTPNKLGTTADGVTIVNVSQSVTGVYRARLVYMNKTGLSGTMNIIQAQNNEYITPNNITVNVETL